MTIAIGAALLATAAQAIADSGCGTGGTWCTDQDKITARMEGVDFVHIPGRPDPKEYHYTASCYIENEVRTADGCVDGTIPPPVQACATGKHIAPRWARLRDSGDGTPGPWILEVGYTCPGDPGFPLTLEDFTQLPITPSTMQLQPPTDWVYAGLDTIAHTDPTPQGFHVELLGASFDVGAVPIEYSWDFGDGTPPLVTDDPGAPWPDYTIGHTYTAAGTATPVLTTSWKGVYRETSFDPWAEIPGTGQTTTTGPELTIYAARTRLVEDPLD